MKAASTTIKTTLPPHLSVLRHLAEIGKPVKNEADFGNLIDAFFEIFYEGSAELKRIPEEFKQESFICFTIKHLRNDLRHDLEHGDEKEVAVKKARLAEIYERFTGKTAINSLQAEDFPKFQLKLLAELRTFLEDLKQYCINN